MLYDAEIMLAFIEEIAEYVPQLRQHLGKLTVKPKDKEALEEAYRLAHTIKGSAAMLELDELSAEGKTLEQTLLPVVEKKAAFTPELGASLLKNVDKVEGLLAKVKADVTGEGAAPEPAMPVIAPPPPPPAELYNFGFEVPEAPPVGFNQTLVPPPPPPPPASLYNQAPSSPPPLETPPVPFIPPARFESGSLRAPDNLPAPPPPPAPGFLYNFDEPEDEIDLAGNFPTFPPPPGEAASPVKSEQVPAVPPSPSAPDFDFDFDLEGLQSIQGFDLTEVNAAVPPPPPPPPYLYETERPANTPGIFPELEAASEIQPALPSEPAPAEKLFIAPEPAREAALPDLAPDLPPAQAQARPDNLDLMDLLFESNDLEALEPDLAAPDPVSERPTFRPGQTAPLTDRWFAWNPDPAPIEPSKTILGDNPTKPAGPSPEPVPSSLPGTGSLDEILSTDPVDHKISLLQNEILDELPAHMTEFTSVPLPNDISVSDAELLTALSSDITNSSVPHLMGLDNGNSLSSPHPASNRENLFQVLPPLEELPASASEQEPLEDFTAAADLLAQFEPDHSYLLEPEPEEAYAATPFVQELSEPAPVIDDDAPTVKSPLAEINRVTEEAPPEATSVAAEVGPQADLLDTPAEQPASSPALSPISSEEFSLTDFEALADSLAAAGEDEEVAHIAGLASLRGLKSIETPIEATEVDQVAAEALARAYSLDETDEAAIEAAAAAMQEEESSEFSEEDLAAAGLGEDDTQMGAFFLAEAQADLDQLKKLVEDFDQPDSDKIAIAQKIAPICGTLRKAASMMDLNGVARQVSVMENTANLVVAGELRPDQQSGKLLHEELTELLALLAPFEEAAAKLFALPEEAAAAEETEAVEAGEVEPAFAEMVAEPEAEAAEEEAATLAESIPPATTPPPVAKPVISPALELDPELAEVFATEAEEHIQNLDIRLAALEKDPNNRELIREIRRTAHTLKGSAAMVGFNVVSQTGHLMEDLLDRLYDGTIPVTEDVVELLFVTFNTMDTQVRGLAAGYPEDASVLDALRPAYAALLSDQEAETEAGGAIIFERKQTPVEAPPEVVVESHRVEEADIEALEAAIAAAEKDQEEEEAPEAAEVAPPVAQPAIAPAIRPASAAQTASNLDNDQLAVKVGIKRLDTMMNQIGELVINRTVLERRNSILNRTVDELLLSIKRLQRVTRELETRYEVELLKTAAVPVGSAAAIEPAYENGNGRGYGTDLLDRIDRHDEFDTLEMDRYTEFHTLSREMTETVDDLAAAWRELDTLKGDLEDAVLQQSRLTDDLQDRVVKVRLVPISNLTPRLYRTVRTIAASQGKDIQFEVSGEQTQIDKTIFEELGDPLLHLVRNAVDHGIETPEAREAAGKPRTATITFAARSEGSQVVIEVRDDGSGIDLEAVRKRAIERGLLAADAQVSDEEIYDLLFVPGFSTSQTITDISGRGVGLDVVRANIARLKGTVEVSSEPGRGTVFLLRLPSTLAITRALLVKVGGYTYAIPLNSIERTIRTEVAAIEDYGERSYYRLEDATIPLLDLNQLLHLRPDQRRNTDEEEDETTRSQFAIRRERPLLIINGPERAALRVDSLVGQQEVVAKSLGTHLKAVPGITGATILGTGEVILILNTYELVSGAIGRRGRYSSVARSSATSSQPAQTTIRRGTTGMLAPRKRTPLIQVVDDSLSIRKVLSAALEKSGFRVRTSKDGQEAYEMVQQVPPDLIVMDIEMPRMDGYELTSLLKSRETYRHIPVVMLTSRAGLKHRQKAEEVGADGFLVKPYREEELLQIVSALLLRARQ